MGSWFSDRLPFVFLPLTFRDVYASFVSILMQIFPFFHNFAIFLFLGNCNFYFYWTERSAIQSVIILVINKSDSRCAVVRFCYHSYDYRLNWTPLSPNTIIYTHIKVRGQKPYPIYDQNGRNQLKLIPYLWPKQPKIHTLWGRTYLYSPY